MTFLSYVYRIYFTRTYFVISLTIATEAAKSALRNTYTLTVGSNLN
jgi:hypothetical protein